MDSSKVGEQYMPVRIADFLAELEANKSPAAETLKAQIKKLKLKSTTTIQADSQDIIAALTNLNPVLKFFEDSKELNPNSFLQILAMTNPTHHEGHLKLEQLKIYTIYPKTTLRRII